MAAFQIASAAGVLRSDFRIWRPTLYAFALWGVALGASRGAEVLAKSASRRLFVLPALLFTAAMVIFPTFFGLYIAFTDWNLNAQSGHHFNGLDNLRTLAERLPFLERARQYGVLCRDGRVQYAIALALVLLNADIRARKFFRVAFLLPFMLSPVAVSWMIGKSIMENRFGPLASFALLGWENPAFFTSLGCPDQHHRDGQLGLDPFIVIMLLAGLQALCRRERGRQVDGANNWQTFWEITFPLMLPVSLTAIVLRIIFELKLADIVINVTAGGPGGATDTISSFVFREYRDRSNVGYATMVAEVYLIIIIIFITLLLKLASRHMQKMT